MYWQEINFLTISFRLIGKQNVLRVQRIKPLDAWDAERFMRLADQTA